jgi:cytochrome P450
MPDLPLTELYGAHYAAHTERIVADLRERCPVGQARTFRGTAWVLTRDDDVRTGFLDPRLVVSEGRPPDAPPPRRPSDVTLMNHDADNHARLRRLAGTALTPARVEIYRSRITSAAAELLTAIDPAQSPIDLVEAFARPFVCRVIGEVFGLAPSAFCDLRRWISAPFDRAGRDPAELERALDEFNAFMRAEVRRRRTASGGAVLAGDGPAGDGPGADLTSDITAAWTAAGDATEDEVVSLCVMLILAGFDSTVQAIATSVLGLLGEPALLARLRGDPARIPRAVDELLRWQSSGPFVTPRLATADLRFGESVVPKGSVVLLSVLGANRDPERYLRPDDIDVDRAAARHLTFGLGPHYCLGAALARMELSVALTELFARFPDLALAVDPADLVWRANHTYRRLAALPVALGPPLTAKQLTAFDSQRSTHSEASIALTSAARGEPSSR